MLKSLFAAVVALSATAAEPALPQPPAPVADLAKPTPIQLGFQDAEIGVIFHFDPRIVTTSKNPIWPYLKSMEDSKLTQEQFNRLVENEMTELCTRYGKFFMVWFDGGAISPEMGGPDLPPSSKSTSPARFFPQPATRRRPLGRNRNRHGALSLLGNVQPHRRAAFLPNEERLPIRRSQWPKLVPGHDYHPVAL